MHRLVTRLNNEHVEEKVWGRTWTLLHTDSVSNHLLKIKPFHRCSKHTHRLRVNQFTLISGDVRVFYHAPGSLMATEQKLIPNQPFSVYPGILHWFETRGEDSIMLETYVGVVEVDDIERADEGRALST